MSLGRVVRIWGLDMITEVHVHNVTARVHAFAEDRIVAPESLQLFKQESIYVVYGD